MRGVLLQLGCCFLLGCPSAKDEVVVFAASSLQDVFPRLTSEFQRTHPGVGVSVSFAGSQELRTQLEHGAKADVFVSADRTHMAALEAAGLVEPPRIVARNELVVVVSEEAARRVTSLEQLPTLERIAIGGPDVPVGRYTKQLLEQLGRKFGPDFVSSVEAKIVSRELSARQVLARVSLGEAEAGVVYRTDVLSPSTHVQIVPLPPGVRVEADYPVAVLGAAPHLARARQWRDFLFTDEALRVFSERGFLVGGSP